MQETSRYNYYEVLELKANAPQHEVTTAYERARATYSGENPAIYTIFSEQEARQLLVVIEEAYQVLGNRNLRGIYDQRLRSGNVDLRDLTFSSIMEASKQIYPEPKPEKLNPTYKKNESFEKSLIHEENWDGTLLKKVREYKQISIQQLSDITKIRGYYIAALEAMESENLPATVFVRGYIVQIAKALGLDTKKVADSYMKRFKADFEK